MTTPGWQGRPRRLLVPKLKQRRQLAAYRSKVKSRFGRPSSGHLPRKNVGVDVVQMTAAADNLLFFNSLETSPQKRGLDPYGSTWPCSPRARGSTRCDRSAAGPDRGCPGPTGIHPRRPSEAARRARLPRTHGDHPLVCGAPRKLGRISPRARGAGQPQDPVPQARGDFPARTGSKNGRHETRPDTT